MLQIHYKITHSNDSYSSQYQGTRVRTRMLQMFITLYHHFCCCYCFVVVVVVAVVAAASVVVVVVVVVVVIVESLSVIY